MKFAIGIAYRIRHLIRVMAVIFAWLYGVQAVLIFIMAEVADMPMPLTSPQVIRFAISMAILYVGPRLIDKAIQKMAANA